METWNVCVAGIDVHKKMLAVVIRRPQGDHAEYDSRKFGTTRSEIEHLAAWLQEQGVQQVVMESTAQYWRPVWYGLEPHFALHLCNPLQVRAPRGRKTDFRDARRLSDRWCAGDLRESFVPGASQREWRWLTRTRVQLKRTMTVVRNRIEGLLEEGGFKLTSVVSDVFGVSGWAMLNRIADGERDLNLLLGEARGALGKKLPELQEALAGRLSPVSRLLLKQHLEQVKLLRQQVEDINQTLAREMQAHLVVLQRLTRIPGIDLYAAQALVAEIGPEARAFPTDDRFVSWVGICPGSQQSAGVSYSDRSAKGNCYLRGLLCQIAWGAIHTKDTFYAALFARFLPRLESKGAAWAVAHRLARTIWLVLHQGVEYQERGAAPPNPRTLMRKFRRLITDCARAGIDLNSLLPQPLAPSA